MTNTPSERIEPLARTQHGDNSGLRARLEDAAVGGSEVTGGFQAILGEREEIVHIPEARKLRFGRRRRS